jgi:hypothetical protein
MPADLTLRQQAILDFVRERIAADGLPPTWALHRWIRSTTG